MRQVKAIEMATNGDIYEVTLGGEITVKESKEAEGFDIFEGTDEIGWTLTRAHADKCAANFCVDEMMLISGWGTWSGRKYWQLPDNIKSEVMRIAEGVAIPRQHY